MRELIESVNFSRGQQDYFRQLLTKLIPDHEGNIVEIGCGHGLNTELFCKIAKQYNRKVIGVDPFESGFEDMPVSYRYGIQEFNNLLGRYSNLHLIQKSSLDSSVLGDLLSFDPIVFAFIDGLQTVEAVLSDISMMEKLNTTLICIDDANRLTGDSRVPEALELYSGNYQVTIKGREAYLCL